MDQGFKKMPQFWEKITTSGSSLEAGDVLLAEMCARQQIHLLPNPAEEQCDGWAMKGRKLGDSFSFI